MSASEAQRNDVDSLPASALHELLDLLSEVESSKHQGGFQTLGLIKLLQAQANVHIHPNEYICSDEIYVS